MIPRYISLLPIYFIAKLLNYPLAPFAVLFADEGGWLPRWLSWLQTPDNPLDGDSGWQIEHRPFKELYIGVWRFQRWINRTCWLYRNGMHGFAAGPLGFQPLQPDSYYHIGSSLIRNRPAPALSGTVKRYIIRHNAHICWQFYMVHQWGNSNRCLRINLGWKLWDFGNRERMSYVFHINPIMGFDK